MEKVVGLEELEKEMWPLKNKFLTTIEPYRSDLWKYCRSLTCSPWDHRRDPDAMAALFHENAYNDIVHVAQEYGRSTMRKWSINDTFKYWTSRIEAHYQMLWGRPVILVFVETEAGMNLKSIIYLETEDDSIVLKKEYYFCKDLLNEAAKELGVPVDDRGVTGP